MYIYILFRTKLNHTLERFFDFCMLESVRNVIYAVLYYTLLCGVNVVVSLLKIYM